MRWCYVAGVAGLTAGLMLMGWSGWQWRHVVKETERVAAIRAGRVPALPDDATPRVRLAWANHLTARRRYDEALEVFSGLLESAPEALAPWVHYNLGNLYLRRARRQVEQTAFDEAMPLVALAKQSYRRTLRLKPDLWAARYNLEAAIRLLPEIERFETGRKEGRDKRREALWTRVPGFPRGLP